MPAQLRPVPLPSDGVDSTAVAISSTVANKRTAAALNQGAGLIGGVRTLTEDDFISSTDGIVQADCTAGNITLTLPEVGEYARNWWFLRRSAGANTFTVAARGSDQIDGGASITVTKMVLVFAVTNADWQSVILEN